MIRTRIAQLASAALLVMAAGFSAPSRADIDIAETPLFLQQPIKPAFIMALDDSGSMQWEVLVRNQDGQLYWNQAADSFFNADGSVRSTGDNNFLELFPFPGRGTKRRAVPPTPNFGFARSHEFNPAYYNPNTVYTPWKRDRADHPSPWPNANPTAAVPDPRLAVSNTNNPAFDLTENIRNTGTAWRFDVRAGMTIMAGTEYREPAECGGFPGGAGTWRVAASDFVATGNCGIEFSYYAPTFYLTSPTFPGYTATPLAIVNPAGGPPGTTLYRYEIRPGNMTGAAYAQQIRNFANWFTYYRNRNLQLVAALTESLYDVSFMRVGQFRINNRNTVTMRDLEVVADKEQLYNDLTAINGNNSTPNRLAANHLGTQFRRTDAAAPIPSDPNLGGACQVNAGMLFTDGYSNSGTVSVGNVDGGMGSPFADTIENTIADIAAQHYLDNIRPGVEPGRMRVPAACSNPTPDPRLDCRPDPHMNFYGVTLGALGVIYGEDMNSTNDPYTYPPPWGPDNDNNLGAVDAIWHATLNTRGRFINARTAEEITKAFEEVLEDIGEKARPAGGVAASATRRDGDFLVYVPEYASEDWTGTLKAYSLGTNGALGSVVWNAGEKLEARAPSSRQMFVSVPSGSGFNLTPFNSGSLGGDSGIEALLGITAADYAAYGAGVTASDVIDYLRGERSQELASGGSLRDRATRMGDILGSQPEVTSRASFGYTALPPAEGGGASGPGSYGEFLNFKRTRRPVVFVGTNAGVLHAFDGRAGATGGDELFSVVPNGVLQRIKEYPKQDYSHLFMLDGSPVQADARVGSNWKTVLVTPGGLGSRSVMALDVTNAGSGFSASDFMWEFQNPGLGLALSRPRVVRLQGGQWVVMFGNGVNSDDNLSRLFVLDLASGSPLQIVQPDANGSDANPNGMIAFVPVDSDFDGGVDTIYSGDMQGRVYKMTVAASGTISVANAGNPLFRALDAGGVAQPITGGMDSALHHLRGNMVYFGTGRFFAENDNVVPTAPAPWPQVQSFYGIWDDPNASTGTVTRSQLQQQQILAEVTTADGPARRVSQNSINWNTRRGFYLDLRRLDALTSSALGVRGERAVGQPRVVQGSILFTTFTPVGDPCNSGGDNRVYVLNALTGAANLGVGGVPACPDCAGVGLPDGPPSLNPPVAATRKESSRDPDDPPVLDAAGNVVAEDAACVLELSLIVDTGARTLRQTSCGRASWRQVQ
jgi:type IV pilus assembly protein PilY1